MFQTRCSKIIQICNQHGRDSFTDQDLEMTDLHQMKCVACRAGEPTLTEGEIYMLHPQIPEWQVKEVGGIKRLEHVFKFKSFAQALEFTNKVGAIAEEENYQPLIQNMGV